MERDVPRGTIAFWSGAINAIPDTWRICDGNRHTPDLRNYFTVAAGLSYAPASTGGSVNHIHTFTSNTHFHANLLGNVVKAGFGKLRGTSAESATGQTDLTTGQPPYHGLPIIMYDGRRF